VAGIRVYAEHPFGSLFLPDELVAEPQAGSRENPSADVASDVLEDAGILPSAFARSAAAAR
jgi:hypothetical protein